MAKKLLLCVSAFSMTAAVWTGRRIATCSAFEDDDAGQAAFQSFIRSAPGAPVYLMADTVDEDYRFETLPHAFGSDRREMVERKLKQLYRSTPFYGANLLERDGDKRRDDRYLLAALTNGEAFTPWLQLLVAAQGADRRCLSTADGEPGVDQTSWAQRTQPAGGVQAHRRNSPDVSEGPTLSHQPPDAGTFR